MHIIHFIIYYLILFGLIAAGINACIRNLTPYPPPLFRLSWYKVADPKTIHRGIIECEKRIIEAVCKTSNREWPMLFHYPERVI